MYKWNSMLDYYQILGVSPSASQKEITAAYRAKCKQLHPDVNHREDATAQMQMVNEAYQVLRRKSQRKAYNNQFGCDYHDDYSHIKYQYGASSPYHSRFYETSSWSDDFKKKEAKGDIEDSWWYFYLVEIPFYTIRDFIFLFVRDKDKKCRFRI